MRIAYVEDNPTNLALVERIARMTQHKVVSYTEGEIALQELQHEKFDLILMDIELAGTVSGLEVVRVLREFGLKTPIIAVTAYAMMGDRDKCLAAGCDDYLPKPLPITDFLAMLAKYDALLQVPAQVSAQPAVAPVAPTPVAAPPLVSRSETHPARRTGALPTPPASVQPAAPVVPPPAVPAPAPASAQPAAPVVTPPVPPAPAPASVQPAAPAVPPPAVPAPAPASVQPAAPVVPPPAPPTPAPVSVQPAAPVVPPPAPPAAEPQPLVPPVAANPTPVILPPAGAPPPSAKETADNGQRPAGTQEASTSGSAANAQPPAAPKEIRMPAHPVDPDEKRTI